MTDRQQALTNGSGASRPGFRRASYGAAFVVLVAAAAFALGLALRGSPSNASSYGGLPAWLPKAKVPVDRTVQASAEHPQLAVVEGDSVSVHLPHGRVVATAVGPAVPAGAAQEAQADSSADADVTTCTFTVTFNAASGRVPINPAAFTIIDERGQVSHLGVSAAGGGSLPVVVAHGRTVTLTMRSMLAEGEYILRWAPAGKRVLVGWEFNVELD
jgi:hypothetical protein